MEDSQQPKEKWERFKALFGKRLWPKNKILVLVGISILVVSLAVWCIIEIPPMQSVELRESLAKAELPEHEKLEKIFDREDRARKTIAQIWGGVLVIAGLVFAGWRTYVLQKQLEVSQEEQITERFTRAIEQLGSDKMAIRLGGVYALERIAKDSKKDHYQIMEILSSYLRSSTKRTPRVESKGHSFSAEDQAVLVVLGRRTIFDDQMDWIDLSNCDFRGADFVPKHLGGVKLHQVSLCNANLSGLMLGGFDFSKTNLMDASLLRTRLYMANLQTLLTRADLSGANLNEANLDTAVLCWTKLSEANLAKANLSHANVYDADFSQANLSGADLSKATNLTCNQIKSAVIDKATKFPDYIEINWKSDTTYEIRMKGQEDPSPNKGP